MIAGYALAPTESPDVGQRVESESDTGPTQLARCITHNIGKKRPDLRVRNRAAETADGASYLILTSLESPPTTFGVIRIEQSAAGSHLTTWLPSKSLSVTPAEVARKLIAGC